MNIERGTAQDLPAVLALLAENDLPVAGLAEHGEALLVARAEGRVVGSAALELYGDQALLRSVAVQRDLRGRGLGKELARAALGMARDHGVRDVYLLTTTAAGFFPRLGFELIARGDIPASVQASVEFRSACPVSAVAMRVHLYSALDS